MIEILISGITSEILQKLYLKIDKDKFNIFGVTRDKSKLKNQDNITLFEGDLTNENFVVKIFNENKFDFVIHGAAITHSFDNKKYFEINLNATKLLVDEIKKSNAACKFVFISSRTAGLKSGGYGVSKLKAEEYIKANLNNWLILRPAEIFGSAKKEGIDKLIKDASTKKILCCPANLKSKLYPIHIDDAVNIMFDYIFNKQFNNQTLTINGNDGYTFIELAKKIAKENNNKLLIIPIPKPLMFFIKYLLTLFKIRNILAPDQIDRLYSEKETIENKNQKIDILKYSSAIFSNKQKFDNIANEYNNIRKNEYGFAGSPDYFEQVRAKYINKLLSSKNNLIIEIGSGQSNFYKLTNICNKIISFDISFNMLKNNSNNYKLNADAFNIPIKNNSVDNILITNVLHHINIGNNIKKILTILYPKLKDNGSIIICEHNPYNPITRYIVSNCSFDNGCTLIYPYQIKKIAKNFKQFNIKYILFFPEILKKIQKLEFLLNKIPLGAQYIFIIKKDAL